MLQIIASDSDRIHAGSDAFQKRRFARAILADKKRHRTGKIDLVDVLYQRERPRECVGISAVLLASAQRRQERRGADLRKH